MKLAIMQPYLFPYVGYFQLMNAVDAFVVYDNIQYTKKGWINRNSILSASKAHPFSIPLKKDSDYLNVEQRCLADNSLREREKILRVINQSYSKAPYCKQVLPLLEDAFFNSEMNLFNFVYHSVVSVVEYLGIDTKIVVSSTLDIDHGLKAQEKVVALCKAMGADTYYNPPGGMSLYSKEEFLQAGLDLSFLVPRQVCYPQLGNEFVPNLSIIDVMMFNSKDEIQGILEEYDLK